MTAPDPTPYAAPTDLRTAADVARWLRERDAAHEGAETLGDAIDTLHARLERERRQACRRGALAEWRRFRAEAGAIDWTGESLDVWGNRRRALDALSRALAFRAAARQP